MKKFLLITLFACITFVTQAQITYEKRIEIEEKEGYGNYETYPFGEDGMLVTYQKEVSSADITELYFDIYNSSLELTDSKKLAVGDKFQAVENCNTEKTGHSLFLDKKNNFVLASLELAGAVVKKVSGALPKKMVTDEMVALEDYVYVSGTIKKQDAVAVINWRTGKTKIVTVEIPDVKPKKVTVQGFQVEAESGNVFLMVKARPNRKTTDMYLLRLYDNGQKRELINLSAKTDKHILSATATTLEGNNYIIMGTYAQNASGASNGVYYLRYNKGKTEYIKFYPYADMKNFLSYLPKKQQEKMEKQIEKKKKKGKDADFNYLVAMHNLIKQSDGYVLLGECYYPTYHTERTTTTTYRNGVPVTTTQSTTVFDGYEYTHAIVMKIDMQGKLLWNKNFKMDISYRPMRVIKFIKVTNQENDQISLVYASSNTLTAKSFDSDGAVIRDKEEELVIKSNSGDRVKNAITIVKPWYKNYFLVSGFQKIKNKEDKNVKRKRYVFYLSKVKYNLD